MLQLIKVGYLFDGYGEREGEKQKLSFVLRVSETINTVSYINGV